MRYLDLIPESHRGLRLARILSPWRLAGEPRTWASLVSEGRELPANANWFEVADAGLTEGERSAATPPRSELTPEIARALTEIRGALDARSIRYYRWAGYGFHGVEVAGVRETVVGSLLAIEAGTAFAAGSYPPTLAHDSAGRFALASLPYPDSIVVAADPELFLALHQTPGIEVVTVSPEDTVPPSAND
ncbi:hypothetical protein D9V32_08820 [Mycetocola tolaasinivorans]|uniref:Uncharacterized protein n=1 Tax=Mycetocola tolaasinivorans TaxID=76635 RepID=A0A3L7A5Q7_9MICO|nr:hypothetical protein [Mycetocola tolaasinivorans]RLP75567.1 hypothetical protein D9V32_08820 [Mycetocola tolaasinivorans]